MFQSIRVATEARIERLRADGGRRALGLGIAIVLEVLLLALLLSLGYSEAPKGKPDVALVEFDATDAEEPAADEEPADQAPAAQPTRPQAQPQTPPEDLPSTPLTLPPPAAVIPTEVRAPPPPPTPPQATPPPSPPRPGVRLRNETMGPPGSAGASSGDTQRVGTAPNGEPMYAAAWYREPTEQELSGYLSTATGPGWGLIACRTVPDFRVEDCVAIDEYPNGSNMNRAILAAAWQFRVRPPRRGGQSMVGAWVRIRITYEMRQAAR